MKMYKFAAARLAVLHLAPFADTLGGTAVNIAVNGAVLFENVKFKDFVPYTDLDAGEYTIDIIPVGATEPALSATVTLQDGVDYSAYAVGNVINQPLGIIAFPVGELPLRMPVDNRSNGMWEIMDCNNAMAVVTLTGDIYRQAVDPSFPLRRSAVINTGLVR